MGAHSGGDNTVEACQMEPGLRTFSISLPGSPLAAPESLVRLALQLRASRRADSGPGSSHSGADLIWLNQPSALFHPDQVVRSNSSHTIASPCRTSFASLRQRLIIHSVSHSTCWSSAETTAAGLQLGGTVPASRLAGSRSQRLLAACIAGA